MKVLFKKCMLRLVLFLLYGVLGSLVFGVIERRKETYSTTANRSLARLKMTMVMKYNLTTLTDSDFNEFVEAAYKAIKTRNQKDWSLTNGFGFTFAALTTVGYGNIVPKTSLGKMFVIPYCLIGLPITMLALKTSGECVLLVLKTLTTTFEKKVLGLENPQCTVIKYFLVIMSCQVFVICMFAVLSMYMDGLSFLDGIYCWFITFTTIGFGDIVPFDNFLSNAQHDGWEIHVIGFFLTVPYIAGLCLVFSLLNLLVESSEKIKLRFQVLCPCSVCNNGVTGREKDKTDYVDDVGQNGIRLENYTITT